MKRFGFLAIDNAQDVSGGDFALLDGNRGQHRQWLTISIKEISRVADDKSIGMLRQLQCGRDPDSSRARPLDPQ